MRRIDNDQVVRQVRELENAQLGPVGRVPDVDPGACRSNDRHRDDATRRDGAYVPVAPSDRRRERGKRSEEATRDPGADSRARSVEVDLRSRPGKAVEPVGKLDRRAHISRDCRWCCTVGRTGEDGAGCRHRWRLGAANEGEHEQPVQHHAPRKRHRQITRRCRDLSNSEVTSPAPTPIIAATKV